MKRIGWMPFCIKSMKPEHFGAWPTWSRLTRDEAASDRPRNLGLVFRIVPIYVREEDLKP